MKKPLPWDELPPRKIPQACYDSRERARTLLTVQALGYKRSEPGDAALGSVRLDAERMFLSQVEATGKATARGLLAFLNMIWKTEDRRDRFLIRLGRALADTSKRRRLPDWLKGVDQTERFIVEGWCASIIVDGEQWPPLCCLMHGTIHKFLKLCERPLAVTDSDMSFRQKIRRLGLVGISNGKIKHVEKKLGQFRFA